MPSDLPPVPISCIVRKLREEHGDSLETLGAAIGLRPRALSRRERGEMDFKTSELDRVARYYGKKLSDLLAAAEEKVS